MTSTVSNKPSEPSAPFALRGNSIRPILSYLASSPHIPWLILVVAALLRFWRLDFHSFWFDEAVSLRWATSDISFIWEKTFPLVEEKHPPAYYTLLHLWLRGLALFNLEYADAAIRSLGALLGLVTTWATMNLATRVSGAAVGRLTGLLVALSPVLIWYSQEARMFQPASTGILCAALGLHGAWFAHRGPVRWAWWALLASGLLFALYSYLFSAFIMPAAGLSLLLLHLAHPARRRFIEGFSVLAVVTLLFLPLAQNAWGVNAAESTPGQAFANFWANHLRLLQVFSVWRVAWPTLLLQLLLIGWGILLLFGLLPVLVNRQAPRAAQPAALTPATRFPAPDRWWLWLWLVLPLLIANILLSRSGSIFNEDRYLVFLVPFFGWAIARGVALVAQRLPAVGIGMGAIAVVSLLLALPQNWRVDNYRENWRAAAHYIIEYTRATPHLSAAAVSHIDYTNIAFQWYLRRELDHDELPVFFPFGGWINPERIEEDVAPPLRGIEDLGVDTLWLIQGHIQYVDPDRLVEGWLQSTYPIVTEFYPAGIKVTGHSLRESYPNVPLADAMAAPPLQVAPDIYLHHCAPVFPAVAARDTVYHPPSGWVHVQSWWSIDADAIPDYLLHARVVAPGGIWGESLTRPSDPFRMHPPSSWAQGAIQRAEVDINLNPITPPGRYDVEIRLEYDGVEYKAPCGTVEIN